MPVSFLKTPSVIGLSRRRFLAAGLSISALAAGAVGGRAIAAPAPPVSARVQRFQLGAFEVSTLLAATRVVPDPHDIFGLNVPTEDFAAVSRAAHIPADRAQFFFTPTLVETGAALVLFDTGPSAAGMRAALGAAGYTPEQVDVVVITHMHGDHIGGLMENGRATFPNARYVTGAVEYDHWAGRENARFDTNVRPLAENMDMVQGGHSVVSGIEAVEAFGHTPGHMAYLLESEGQTLLVAVDFANHYVWSLEHPGWEVKFDQDRTMAAATRRSLLSMLATEQMPFIGYHMPFPALGYVDAREGRFHYVPHSYQLTLG